MCHRERCGPGGVIRNLVRRAHELLWKNCCGRRCGSFFQEQDTATADEIGADIRFAATLEDLDENLKTGIVRLVMISLEIRSLDPIAEIAAATRCPEARIGAFVNHVYEGLQERARAAGCSQVMAKDTFSKELPALLNGLADGS